MKYLKKTIVVFVLLLLVITGVVTYINSRIFSQNLQTIIKNLDLNIKVGDAKFVGYGKIKITDLIIYDKDKNPAIESGEAYIYLNPLNISRVRKIDVYSPNVILEKKADMKFNIVEMFSSDSPNIDRTSRIGRINFYNANLDYRDTSYEKLIQKNLGNVDGYVEFTKKNGIVLEAKGHNGDEGVGVILKITPPKTNTINEFLKRKTKHESTTYFELNFDKLGIFPEAIQYVPFDGLEIYDGKLSGNLKFGESKKFSGDLHIENSTVKYADYDGILNNVNADVTLRDNNVDVKTAANINGGHLDLGIKFLEKTKVVKLEIKADNVDYLDIKKYKLIKEQNIEAFGRVTGTFNADLDLDKKEYEFSGFLSSTDLQYSGYNFKNLRTNLLYNKNGLLSLNNISFGFNQNISGVNIIANARVEFSYDTKLKVGTGNYEIDNINSDFSVKRVSGDLHVDSNTIVRSNFFSNELDGNFNFDPKSKILELNTKGKNFFNLIYAKNNLTLKPTLKNLRINLDKFSLISGSAEVDIIKNEYFDQLKVLANVRNGNFDVNAAASINGQLIRATGTTDSNFNHKYKVYGSNINVKPLLQKFNVKINGIEKADIITDFNANIYTQNGKLKGDFNLDSRRGKYFVEYEKLNVSGSIEDLLAGKLVAKVKAEEIWINYQRFKNLSGEVSYENNTLNLKNFKNEDLQANIQYNLKTQDVLLNAKIFNYVLYNVSKPEVNFILTELEAKLSGTVDSLNGNIKVGPSKVAIDNRNLGDLRANIDVQNSVLNFNDVDWRANSIKGTYDLNTQIADIYIHIDEQESQDIHNIPGLSLALDTDLRLQGKLSDFTITGNINADKMQYSDLKLPRVETTIAYRNGDINKLLKKGSLDISKFILKGEDGEQILNTKTKVDDLATSQLNFDLKDYKLDLESIKGFKEKGYSGIINYSLILRGNIDNFFMDVKAESKNFSISGFGFDNLTIDMQVNNKGINIGQLYLEYEDNPLLVNGYVSFNPVDYNINILAENFNLDFLKAGKDMKDAGGIANLDVTLTPTNVTGEIDLQNFVFIDKAGNIDISNLNANIDIEDRKLVVNNFNGNYNGGVITISGNLDVPGLAPDFAETKRIDLGDFDLKIALDKTKIKYGKTFQGVLSADLSFTEKELTGSVIVDSGTISDVSQFLAKEDKVEDTTKERSLIDGIQSEIVEIIMGQYSANVRVNLMKGVDLDIASVSLVRGVKGVLKGDGAIMLNSGNITASGDFYISKGKFTLSERKFALDQAEIRYGAGGFGGSEITNPFVVILATTSINNDQISVSISGSLNDPQIKFNSTLGLTQEQILALLIFDARTSDNKEFETYDQNRQLGNILDTTLNQLIFNPVIGKIEETLGFSSIVLKTNLLTQSDNNNSNQDIGSNIAPSIYIQDSLYKDRLYWNVELGYGQDNATGSGSAGLDYNFWVTYRVSEKFGVNLGLKNLRSTETAADDTNYYLGIEFSTRFYSFDEFIRSLKKPKLEVITNQEN